MVLLAQGQETGSRAELRREPSVGTAVFEGRSGERRGWGQLGPGRSRERMGCYCGQQGGLEIWSDVLVQSVGRGRGAG